MVADVQMPGISFGMLLRELREEANLTQEALAARSGLSANAISMLERGVRRSPRRSTVDLLSRALRLDAEKARALWTATRPAADASGDLATATARAVLASPPGDAPPPHAPLPVGSRMPLAPNPLFVGRGDELVRIAAALGAGEGTAAPGQIVASTGLGGLGKTQLAVEFVHRYGRFFAGGVFWLSFATADEIRLQVAALAGSGAAGLEAHTSRLPLEERVELVTGAWQSEVPRLLVFDDCEEESLLEQWRPTSGGCLVLVTSRRSHWSPTLGVTALPLDLLPRQQSIELLGSYRPDLARDDPRLDAVAEKLGDLPLALHLAGRYLLVYRAEVGLDDYLAELDQPALIEHASLLGEGLDDSPSPTHHVQSLAQTFAVCLDRLDLEHDVDRVAIALLARMAWMAPGEAVPRNLLARTLEEVEPRRRTNGLRRLGAVGMVEEGEGWLRLHRLLVHFARHRGLDADAPAAVARALIACGEDAKRGHVTGSALSAVIPHLLHVSGAAVGGGAELLAAELSNATGWTLMQSGDLRAARPWCERALAIRERVLEPDHLLTAEVMSDLGDLLWHLGEPAAAGPLFERVLDIRERVLGPDHPDTADSLSNLGVLMKHRGEPAAARPLFERALAISERASGPNHPRTANILNNFAVLLRDLGELAAAQTLFERAAAIWEVEFGPDHPHTADGLYGLAVVLQGQGDLAGARTLNERAIEIWERVLGTDHPCTAWGFNNLGRLLRDLGELAAARTLFERALAVRERVLGSDHPHTVATRCALAELSPDPPTDSDRHA
jgi:tetratricopeptide (TPR) repeat protein/transcriptional regulator with XRE-family HTH domain